MNRPIECPHCNNSYYMERYVTRTLMYLPPIYRDGVNINPDKNISTHVCTCLKCGNIFSYRECMGEVINE